MFSPKHHPRALLIAGALAAGVSLLCASPGLSQDSQPLTTRDATIVAEYIGAAAGDGAPKSLLVASGRLSVVTFGAAFDGPAPADGPVTATVTLPDGLVFVRARTVMPESLTQEAQWICTATAPTVTCTLGTTGNASTPYALSPDQSPQMILVLQGTDSLPPVAAGGAPIDMGVVQADLSVPQAGAAPLTASTTVPVQSTGEPPAPRIVVSKVLRPSTTPGNPATWEGYDLIPQNVGSAAVAAGDGAPALQISHVLPNLPFRGTTVTGAGWRCSTKGKGTCRTMQGMAVGDLAKVIKVRWPARTDASKINYRWMLTGIAHFDGALFRVSDTSTDPRAVPPPANTALFKSPMELNLADTLVDLEIHADAPKGIQVVAGRGPTKLVMGMTNVGDTHGRIVGTTITIPKGVLASVPTKGWTCEGVSPTITCRSAGSLTPRADAHFDLMLSAPAGMPAGPGKIVFAPIGRKNGVRGVERTVALAIVDPGDAVATPRVLFLTKSTWTRWVDGSSQRVPALDDFTYRIALFNSGGDALKPGVPVSIRQQIGAAMGLKAVQPGEGVTCAPGPDVACTFTPSAPVAPDATFGNVLVTVHPTKPDPTANLGVINAAVAGSNVTKALPMKVEVVDNPNSLRPSMAVTQEPTSGGVGKMSMILGNEGTDPVSGLSATGRLPANVRVARITAPSGWQCSAPTRRTVACGYRGTVRGKARTPGVVVHLAAAPGQGASRAEMVWKARGRASDGSLQAGMRKALLPVRAHITVGATATPKVVSAVREMTAYHRRVALDGTSSVGNGISLTYRWSQRCLTPGDVTKLRACKGRVTPTARIDSATLPSTHAVLPIVTTRTQFVFDLTITDRSATQRKTVTVVQAVPQKLARTATRGTGLSQSDTAARAGIVAEQRAAATARQRAVRGTTASRRAAAASNARRARAARSNTPRVNIGGGGFVSAKPGTVVPLTAQTRGAWGGAVTYSWSQVSGPAATISSPTARQTDIRTPNSKSPVVMRVRARDAEGHVATGQVMVGAGGSGSPQAVAVLSQAAKAAASGNPLSVKLAPGAATTLRGLRSMASGQATSEPSGPQYTFSKSDLSVGQVSVKGASGTLSTTGITLTTGTITLPASWRIGPLSVGKGKAIIYTFAAGNVPSGLVGQIVDATHFPLLTLPTGWAGTTTITFAKNSWSIEATATGGKEGKVVVEGTVKEDGTYTASVTGTHVLNVGGSPMDLAGTITKTAPDQDATTTVTGSIVNPVQLADGVSLEGVTAKWMPDVKKGPTLTGSATVKIDSGASDPLQIAANLRYTGSEDWTLDLAGKGGPTWSPLPGLALSAANLTGSIGQEKGVSKWDITGKLATWQVSSILTLSNVQLNLTNDCGDGTQPACPKGTMFLKLSTDATLAPPVISPINAKATAILGLGDGGGFSLYATLPNLNLGAGVELGSPSLNVTYNMPEGLLPSSVGMPSFDLPDKINGGFVINAMGSLSVPGLGNFGSIVSMITPKGWTLGGFDADGVSLGSDNGGQSGAWFGWSSFDTTMSINLPGVGVRSIPIPKGSFSVTGDYSAPEWFTKMAGIESAHAVGTITFQADTGFFNAKVDLDGTYTLPGGGSSVQASSLFFEIQNNSTGLTVSVGATTTLGVKGMDANGTQVQAPKLEMRLAYDAMVQTASASLTFTDDAGWQDAFGVDGLVVNKASITLQVNLVTLTPGIKLMAVGQLPSSVAGPLGVPGQGIPITVGAELSAEHPCIDFQVGKEGGPAVLQLGGGVATASFFQFILAPSGCQLSPDSKPIAPGFSIQFSGTILDTPVDVGATLEIEPMLKLDGHLDIGAFTVGGVAFDETQLKVHLDEAAGVNEVSFSGGFTIFGNGVKVLGNLRQAGDTTSASLEVQQVGAISVDGFTLEDMRFSAAVEVGPGVNKVSISAAGKVNILGQMLNVREFKVAIDNGVVEDISFDIQAKIDIADVATADGEFQMSYSESTGDFQLHAKVALTTAAGFNIGSADKPATLDIEPACAAFEGTVQIGTVFQATLQGTFVYKDGCTQTVRTVTGEQVAPTTGDFSLSANNVSLNLGEFETTGSVAIGDVGGTAYATASAALTLGTEQAGGTVNVSGAFQSNGDFAFDGSGNLGLAGLQLNVAAHVSNAGGNVEVTGRAQLNIGDTVVEINGRFTEINGVPSVTLRGAVDRLVLAGFNVGHADVTLTQTPTDMSVEANVAMSVGDPSSGQIQANGTISFVQGAKTGGVPLFYASLRGTMGFPSIGATMDGSVTFTNCANNCSQLGPVQFSLSGNIAAAGFNFVTNINMSSDGTFSASAVFNTNMCSGTINLLIVQAQGCFAVNLTLFVGSQAPYASIDGNVNVSVDIQTWDADPWYAPWEWSWGPWYSFGVNLSASFQLSPFRACVGVMGKDLCI